MSTDRVRERTVGMIEDALERGLAGAEVVDAIDFGLMVIATQQGLQSAAFFHVAVKGTLLGTSVGHTDVTVELGMLGSQEFVDSRLRACFEQIRVRKATELATSNGHGAQAVGGA